MSSMRVLALVLVVTLASPSWGRMEDWKTIELGKSCACWSKAKSEQAARVDNSKLQRYRASFAAASYKYNLPKEILMAVASRESRVGSLLGKNGNKPGWGDKNRAFGIMQVDKRYHKVVDETNIDNVDEGAKILANMLRQVKKKHPNWSYGWHLRGAVAAYNFGSKNLQTLWRQLFLGHPAEGKMACGQGKDNANAMSK